MAEASQESVVDITRVFDAPRERVFAAWTRAEHFARWFVPAGFTVPACEIGEAAGGPFRLCIRSPEGRDYWVNGVFRRFERPGRLVIACTADGRENARLEELIDVTLTEEGGRTTLHLHASTRAASAGAGAAVEAMPQMWASTVARLAEHLHGKLGVDATK